MTEHTCQRLHTLRDDKGAVIKSYRCGRLIYPTEMYCPECAHELAHEYHMRGEVDYCAVCD